MIRWLALVGLLALTGCALVDALAVTPAGQPTGGQAGPEQGPSRGASAPGLRVSTEGWRTDFSRHGVPLEELQPGGPGRDGIPPLDTPAFVSYANADAWLRDGEPVVALALAGEARAYPLQILIWHEIVNDTVGGLPVAVSFCPLCNTAIAFDRRLDGRVLDFGTTGNLRYSDLVMWDRQTETWWQQVTGEAIVGELTGARLTTLPASIVSYGEFKRAYREGLVLSRDTGYRRDYGRNPYIGYDDVSSSPFLYRGPMDGRLRPMERVVTVSLNGQDVAYPFRVLAERGVIEDDVGGQPVVVFFESGTASALDRASIAESRDVGATGVFEPRAGGRALRFAAAAGTIRDRETSSRWNVLGQATDGPFAGQQLAPVVHGNHFWFAWSVFKPATRVYQ